MEQGHAHLDGAAAQPESNNEALPYEVRQFLNITANILKRRQSIETTTQPDQRTPVEEAA